ncbi:MAG TPA: N-acyl homoserine lactonase family protein [Candidatus Dormibacteraeota bacterium]|nr:N-acyl homoserine lactonase family protein [Candidatus Dormibacteraeota bacterium]
MEIVRLHLAKIRGFNGVPVHGFLIKHPRAGAILVDTGVGYPDDLIKEWRVVNRHAAEAMAEHGLSPADVRIVVNTHLHFDHCGQNAVFKHAPFYVQRSELDRARREETATSEWFDFAGARFELLDGDVEVAEGVRVVATPGHTIGHQSVLVEADDGGGGQGGQAVMIGDAAYTADIYAAGDEADLTKWRGQYQDRESWSGSLRRLREMHPHAVHFCHDTRVLGHG